MAFDRTNQADLDALKTEFVNDPISMDYAGANDGTTKILNLFNKPELNVGGETQGAKLTVDLLLQGISQSPNNTGTEGDRWWLDKVLEEGEDAGGDIEKWRNSVIDLWGASNPIRQFIEAATMPLSRAEVLFGAETVISKADWIAARDNGVVV